jgi:putative redox protein
MAHTITVNHESGERFAVNVRGHRLTVDQRHEVPGVEAGPTPVELFVAALASCAAHSAQLVLSRIDPSASVTTTCEYEMSSTPPWRVEFVHVAIILPGALSEARIASIRRAVDQCTVHTSIRRPIDVAVTIVAPADPAHADAAAVLQLSGPPAPAGRRSSD